MYLNRNISYRANWVGICDAFSACYVNQKRWKLFFVEDLFGWGARGPRTPVCLHSHQHIYCLNVLGILVSLNKKSKVRYLIASFCALLCSRYRAALHRRPFVFEKVLRNRIYINIFLSVIMLVIVWASNLIMDFTSFHFNAPHIPSL